MKKSMIAVMCTAIISIFFMNGCAMHLEQSVSATNNEAVSETKEDGVQIGVALYSVQNEYTKRFADAIQEQAEQMEIEVQLYDGNYDASRQNAQVEEMIQNGVDGILIIPQDSEDCVEAVESACEAGIPIVAVNTRVHSEKISSYVGSDDTEAGKLVAESIAEVLNGAGNIVILEGPIGQSAQQERLKGIKDVLAEYPELHVIGNKTANWSRLEAKSVMTKWLQTFDRIDAVIAENDDMALGALDAIKETDKEIYVVGIDGSEEGIQAVEEGRMYMTVFQDAESQSQSALDVILKCMNDETVEESYWIPLKKIEYQ